MTIRFACPTCRKNLSAPDERAGTQVNCPACYTRMTIPAAPTAVQHRAQATAPAANQLNPFPGAGTIGGSYIDQSLTKDEQIVYRANIHWGLFLPLVILWSLWFVVFVMLFAAGGGLVVVALVFGLIPLTVTAEKVIYYLTTEFAVTNKRILAKRGFISRKTLELLLTKVESIGVDQGIVERLFDSGTVTVTGTGGAHNSFKFISEAMRCRKVIQNIVDSVQSQPR